MSVFVPYGSYTGPVKAVVLDWSGTAIDFGCMGPPTAFVNIFERYEIEITISEVRQFMGLGKKEHVRRLCQMPKVVAQWQKKYHRTPDEDDINLVFQQMEVMMLTTIADHAAPIKGLLPFVDELHRKNIKIGSCTGYTAPIMQSLVVETVKYGFLPDCIVCASDVPAGRPFPWMCYKNAIGLQVYPFESMIKIGDTISDIIEGLNAGMWTIGVTQSGNELGLSPNQVMALSSHELDQRLAAIESRFREAGAHYVVKGIWECLPIIDAIGRRLAEGDHPLNDTMQPLSPAIASVGG
jgi:phosphonoacetaldehyde hydrolase